MKFEDYQNGAMATRLPTADIMYAVLNLAGEAGEVTSKYAKALRDGTVIDREAVALELGDVLWCVALACEELEIPMGKVAQMNLDKLASRASRGKLSGSGDVR